MAVKNEDWSNIPNWMKEQVVELVSVAAYLSANDPDKYAEILQKVRS